MPLAPDILARLIALVGEQRVKVDADSLAHWGGDWTRVYRPAPSAIVFPSTTEEVQAIVRLANEARLALVPSGGRTGLSAAAVAAQGEVVVSFDHMNRILEFIPEDRLVRLQPGVVTGQLQAFAHEQGLHYPVDFASAGSSQLGGNIGTNAGGIKVIKYGMTRQWVLGLKVVTGQGDVLDLNKGMMKNATGYDLRHLFIGAEGTLGFVVEALMKLERQPRDLRVMVLGTPDFDAVMKVLSAFQKQIDLTAFEFFSELALQMVTQHQGVPRPFEATTPFYVLLEFEAASEGVVDEAMALFESCVEQGWVVDGVMSQSQAQAKTLWRLREDISETISRYTPYKNDLSVLIQRVPAFIGEIDRIVASRYPDFRVVWFGHIGDGNLHLNILKPDDMGKEEFFAKCASVNDEVFQTVARYEGSVSAEHGVGMTKKPYLGYSRSPAELAYMKAIKLVFDPNNVMNPGKLLDL
ncbi:MAG: FAD-binding oxidoreductase [Rubrivivax sp.]|nr:MAG: FAD-binding oxidoreductase [Rubrivivax sp.]